MRWREGNNREKGFTLLEVLISLVILALVALTSLSLQNRSVSSLDAAIATTEATLLAQEMMAESLLQGYPTAESSRGEFKDRGGDFRWERVVEETEYQGVRKITLRVFWKGRGGERSVELLTFAAEGREP